jgi:hypothetical protein
MKIASHELALKKFNFLPDFACLPWVEFTFETVYSIWSHSSYLWREANNHNILPVLPFWFCRSEPHLFIKTAFYLDRVDIITHTSGGTVFSGYPVIMFSV